MVALRDAFIDGLASRYDEDLAFQLQRVRYIYATEALHVAAVESDFAARAELTAALTTVLSKPNRHAAPLLAGAAMLALDTAMDAWQRSHAKTALADHLRDAFAVLARLDSIT